MLISITKSAPSCFSNFVTPIQEMYCHNGLCSHGSQVEYITGTATGVAEDLNYANSNQYTFTITGNKKRVTNNGGNWFLPEHRTNTYTDLSTDLTIIGNFFATKTDWTDDATLEAYVAKFVADPHFIDNPANWRFNGYSAGYKPDNVITHLNDFSESKWQYGRRPLGREHTTARFFYL